jgi:hypothetical protein
MFSWVFPGEEPFFNKGKGRSIMVSAFIVMHDHADVFVLNQNEWENACREYPELLISDPQINYYERSANAWIQPKKDNNLHNKIIIKQFERFFKLLKF